MKRHTKQSEASFIYDPKPDERRRGWRNFGTIFCLLFTDVILGIGAMYLIKYFGAFPWYIKAPMSIIIVADIFSAHFLVVKAIQKANPD